MSDTEQLNLNTLENQIDNLLDIVERLQLENRTVRKKLAQSLRERSRLQEKTSRVVDRLKTVILKLKDELA